MPLPQDVSALLDILLPRLRAILGTNLVGVYLRGSLAFGDFIPATSDIDLLTVTAQRIDDAAFAALAAMHTALALLPHPFAQRLEITYLDCSNLKQFQPGQRHPTLGQGEALVWSEHGANWVIERWTVREHGIIVLGPDPQGLIDPITPDELRSATRFRLHDWATWANQHADPAWLLPRSHKAYVVETMCRMLYTLACGVVASKPQAVQWARTTLPEPSRTLVEQSQAWRTDATHDLTIVPAVRQFVQWTVTTGTRITMDLPCSPASP
jgi:hypothetical protein